ncbi:MAG: hypothetical protein GKS06_11445 [Acidobacteria bacterium]|nr:hypothetical protein [Acidobacteriota bacterium]
MSTIDADDFGTIERDETTNLVRLSWLPETEDMTLEDFRNTLTVLADAVVEHGASGALVDVREFRSEVPEEDDGWREEVIVPRYNTVLSRFAWLAGPEFEELPGGGGVYSNDGEEYANRWFHDEDEAIAWATA